MKKDVTDTIAYMQSYQSRLFAVLDEFFQRATGLKALKFATFDTFSQVVRSEAQTLAPRGEAAFKWVMRELDDLYSSECANAFAAAKKLGGLKVVLGGRSRFQESEFRAVTSTLLYADTVLIPDPVMPWIETNRSDERFARVLFLKSVFSALHLQPLVDNDFHYPPVFMFPSMEKLLETNDSQTKREIHQLVTDVFCHYMQSNFENIDDVHQFATKFPDQFMRAVQQKNLFVAPGVPVGTPLKDALKQYESYVKTWRSEAWLKKYEESPVELRVLNAIVERLLPQYHLLENTDELGSHPLLTIEQQAHYYKLVSQTNTARLAHLGLLSNKSQSLIDGVASKRLQWLSNVPMSALVELRKNNENVAFRNRLEGVIRKMHDSTVGNIDRVAAEIAQELKSAISDHDREVHEIQSKYSCAHGKTAVAAWAAFAVTLVPSIAPFVGGIAAPFALVAKYAWDKIDEVKTKKAKSRSIMGIIATHYDKSCRDG